MRNVLVVGFTFKAKERGGPSLFNLNHPWQNTTPYHATPQPHTLHTPPLFLHRHPSLPFPTIISVALPKSPSRSPHSISQQRRKELSKALLGIRGGSSTGTSRRSCIEVVGWLGAKSTWKLIVYLRLRRIWVLCWTAQRERQGNYQCNWSGILHWLGVDQMAWRIGQHQL